MVVSSCVKSISMEDKMATIEPGAILKAFQEKDKNRDGFLSREDQGFL